MELIDTHAHLDQDEFAEDREQVISDAVSAGICTTLAGVSFGDSLKDRSLKRKKAAHEAAFLLRNPAVLVASNAEDRRTAGRA